MEGISEIIEAISSAATVVVSVLALFFSAYSLINANRLKSYEFMIQHRLKTYDLLQNRFSELKHLTSTDYMDAHREKKSLTEFSELLGKYIDELEVVFSRSERQEFLMLDCCRKLKNSALAYYQAPSEASKTELLKNTEIVFDFADIYLWSLWQYLQQLYEKKKAKMPELFEKELIKTYERTKVNYLREKKLSAFFEKYKTVEELLIEKRGSRS